MSQLLEVSESARRKLQDVLPPATAGTLAVRVSARLGDTGRPAYELTAMESRDGRDGRDGWDGPAGGSEAGDIVVDLDGLALHVDSASAPLLAGVRIDHVETPRASGFLFRPSDAMLTDRVKTALEEVRPRLQEDGGDVELVEVRDARAVLAFKGSCVGCSMASMTLTKLLETHLRQAVPELTAVAAQTVSPQAVSPQAGRSSHRPILRRPVEQL
jgi:iron-sulfur cluster assembly protein